MGAAHKISLREAFPLVTYRDPVLRACSQAGLVNNLNDALAWGLAPLYLAADGASASQIGAVAAVYPAVWGLGQLGTGWLSDHVGRKPLIALGMLLQGLALALLVAGGGAFAPSLVAAILLGAGTAMVYPTLIAAVSDAVEPRDRAQAVGIYRFWRDMGFVAGGLTAGIVADVAGNGGAIALVAALTAAQRRLGGSDPVACVRHRAIRLIRRRQIAHHRFDGRSVRATHARRAPRRGRGADRRVYSPAETYAAMESGALLIDIRSDSDRDRDGIVPGSLHIPRTVLEWRIAPDSEFRNPHLGDLDQQVILICDHGCSTDPRGRRPQGTRVRVAPGT